MATLQWIGTHATVVKINDSEKCCVNCKHFIRHYTRAGWQFVPINVGHCVYPRLKDRSAEQVCKHFERKDGQDT